MRTEKEMYDLILDIAQKDERIRAVYMNGSRTNTNVQIDIFQDYDIVYIVTETKSLCTGYVKFCSKKAARENAFMESGYNDRFFRQYREVCKVYV